MAEILHGAGYSHFPIMDVCRLPKPQSIMAKVNTSTSNEIRTIPFESMPRGTGSTLGKSDKDSATANDLSNRPHGKRTFRIGDGIEWTSEGGGTQGTFAMTYRQTSERRHEVVRLDGAEGGESVVNIVGGDGNEDVWFLSTLCGGSSCPDCEPDSVTWSESSQQGFGSGFDGCSASHPLGIFEIENNSGAPIEINLIKNTSRTNRIAFDNTGLDTSKVSVDSTYDVTKITVATGFKTGNLASRFTAHFTGTGRAGRVCDVEYEVPEGGAGRKLFLVRPPDGWPTPSYLEQSAHNFT